MIIREVLEADWNVDRIDVTVRNQCGEFITAYIIGMDVKPSRYHRYQYEVKAGSIYENQGCKYVFINRIIQHHQLGGNFREKVKSFGVLLEEIPKELLNLEIDSMRPYHMGCSDDLHGYRFVCRTNEWSGIPGEAEKQEENT